MRREIVIAVLIALAVLVIAGVESLRAPHCKAVTWYVAGNFITLERCDDDSGK